MKRILKIVVLILLVLGLSGTLFMGCMSFRKSSKKISKDLNQNQIQHEVINDTFQNYEGRYIKYEFNDSAPFLIFIHGAPGSSTAFTDYLKDSSLNQQFNMIVVDRLGYGYSSYGEYASIKTQAAWIQSISNDLPSSKVYTIGHSFGGPIAALSAIGEQHKIKGAIMIAPAIDPNNEKYFPGGKLAWWKATRWMFSKAWRVSATEKYKHEEELKSIENEWNKILVPVLHIHGDKDGLVPVENIDFSAQHFPKKLLRTVKISNKGHLIPFTDPKMCIEYITEFVKNN